MKSVRHQVSIRSTAALVAASLLGACTHVEGGASLNMNLKAHTYLAPLLPQNPLADSVPANSRQQQIQREPVQPQAGVED